MQDGNKDTPEWLKKFEETPEGKIASVGIKLCAVTYPLPSPLSVLGAPLIIVGAATHGLRKLFGG